MSDANQTTNLEQFPGQCHRGGPWNGAAAQPQCHAPLSRAEIRDGVPGSSYPPPGGSGWGWHLHSSWDAVSVQPGGRSGGQPVTGAARPQVRPDRPAAGRLRPADAGFLQEVLLEFQTPPDRSTTAPSTGAFSDVPPAVQSGFHAGDGQPVGNVLPRQDAGPGRSMPPTDRGDCLLAPGGWDAVPLPVNCPPC